MEQSKHYFWNLESLRFIAVMMVYLQHGFQKSIEYLNIQGTFLERVLYLLCDGGIGVSIFFVLSGFLITYLLISEHEQNRSISVRKFYLRRMLRIWPLFFTVLFFSFCLYPFLKNLIGISSPNFYHWLYHITFFSNFDILEIQKNHYGSDAMINNITWSVSIEEQFYLVWPLLFLLKRKFWLKGIIGMLLFSLAFRIWHHQDFIVLYFHTFAVFIDLSVGALFAYLIKNNEKVRSFFVKTSTPEHLVLFIVSFVFLLLNPYWVSLPYGVAMVRLFTALLFGAIISAQALTQNNSFLNLEKIRVATFFGKYTYGIYLLHPVAILIMDVSLRLLGVSSDNFILSFSEGLAGLILTLLLSLMSYHYLELPFLKLKGRFSNIKVQEERSH